MRALFIDIETVPMPTEVLRANMPTFKAASNIKDAAKKAASIEAKQKVYLEKAALSPSTGMVMAIGLYDDDKGYRAYISEEPTSRTEEARVLQSAMDEIMEIGETTLYGWNINAFDLPFMLRRCWANRIKAYITVYPKAGERTTFPRIGIGVFDLMTYMAGAYEWRHLSLNAACNELGIDSKVDLANSLPYDVYSSDRELFEAYLERDVRVMHEIAEIIIN